MTVLRYSVRAMYVVREWYGVTLLNRQMRATALHCSNDRHFLGYPCLPIEVTDSPALRNSCSGLVLSGISAPWCVGPRQPNVRHFPVPRYLTQVTDSKTVHAICSHSSLAFWSLPHVPLLNSILSPMLTVCLGHFGELNCHPHFT